MRGGPGAGLLFYFPPLWSSSLSRIQQKREGERGGEETSHWIFHEWFLSEEKEHLCLWRVLGGDTESRMWLPAPGYPGKCAAPHSSGKIQHFKITAEKDPDSPSVLSECSCLLCTGEAAMIPRGFGSEVQRVRMLSPLKNKPFLPQNDEKSLTASLVRVSEKGCWVARQVHVPPHITWGHPWVPPEPMRSFSFFFFLLRFPHLPQRHLGLARAGKVKQGLILLGVEALSWITHSGLHLSPYLRPAGSSGWLELWGPSLLFELRALSLSVEPRGNFTSQFLSYVVIKDALEEAPPRAQLWVSY